MLNKLRKGAASGWAAKILIGLLVVSFAAIGIADIFNPAGNTDLATIGEDKLTSQEFAQAQNELLSRRNIPEAQMPIFRRFVLQKLIQEKLLDAHVRDLNLGIAEERIARDIVDQPDFKGLNGQFSKSVFDQYLQNRRISESYYVSQLKRNNLRFQLTSVLDSNITPPSPLIDAQYKYENETRTLEFVNLSKKALPKIEAAKPEELQEYYKNNLYQFKAPEYRKIGYLHLSANLLKDTIEIPEEDVKKTYESTIKNYTKAEKRKLLQISFPDLKKAEEAYKKLKSGAKFAAVAKENGQKAEDIDLGLKEKKAILDSKIAEEAFKLKKGTFSKPIKGSLNTVIVKVEKIEKEEVTPFKKVQKQISDRLAFQKAVEKVTTLRKTVEKERDAGKGLKEIGGKYKIKFEEVSVDSNAAGPDGKPVKEFPAEQKFLKEVFDSDTGIENEPMSLSTGDVVWFDILGITKARDKKFEEVKDEVAAKWLAQKERKALRDKSKELVDRLKKGEKLAVIAKELGAKVQKTKAIKRTETPKGLTAATVSQSFTLAKDGFGVANAPKLEGRNIFQVVEIKTPEKVDDKQRKELETKLSRSMIRDMVSQYEAGLRAQYNLVIHEDVIARIMRSSS